LPSSLDLDGSAGNFQALTRRRGVGDAASLLRLALACGPCGLSLRGTASWAELRGVASISDVAVLKPLRGAADWLEHIVGEILADRAGLGSELERPLRLSDGATIAKPGSKGTDWRIHAIDDLDGGRFGHFEVTDGKGAEALQRGAVVPGELRIADRYYARLKGLSHITDGGGDFIVRTGWRKVTLSQRDGSRFDLFAVLEGAGVGRPADVPVCIVNHAQGPNLPVRLIAIRKPEDAAERERKRVRRRASKSGKRLDDRTLIAADYILLLTSLPGAAFDADRIAALYRLRWQIELASNG